MLPFKNKSWMVNGRCSESVAQSPNTLPCDNESTSPPKIKTVRIIDNPFPDIVPRITAAEKRAQKRAREEAQREREEEIRRKGAKK